MGVVAMEVTDSFRSRGYQHITQAAYIYCDECGSFRVNKTLSERQGFLIFLGFLGIGALVYLKIVWFYIVLLALVYCIFLIGLWGLPDYRCLKCGYITTTHYNTRDLSSDKSILDVAEEDVEKLYFNYWPDEGDLTEHLKLPHPQKDSNHLDKL